MLSSGISIGEVVRALNALGVSPRDLISILQALKAAGALQAELEII
jgi:flagellar P-ring protein precursor FlgI